MKSKKDYQISDIINEATKLTQYLSPFLKNVAILFFVNITFLKSHNTYSLQKNKKPKNISEVVLPPEINKQSLLINHKTNNDLAEEYKNIVVSFQKKLSSIFSEEDLSIFYNNLVSLKIFENSKKISHIPFGNNILGEYDSDKNSITFSKDSDISTIYHELFHVASSVNDDTNYYSGFRINSKKNSLIIGRGINEGYTELLTERYFINGESRRYFYSKNIVKFLEIIVGKEKMEKLYLCANLYGLINELKKYSTDNDIMKFINNMDFLLTYMYSKEWIPTKEQSIKNCLKEINTFLIYCYANKLKLNINRLQYSDNKAITSIMFNFIRGLGNYVIVGNKKYDLSDDNILNDVMNSVFGEDIKISK